MDLKKMQDYSERYEDITDETELNNMLDDIMNNGIRKWISFETQGKIKVLSMSVNDLDILKAFIDSFLMPFFHEKTIGRYPKISLACLTLASKLKTKISRTAIGNITRVAKEYILNSEIKLDNLSKDEYEMYDGIIAAYYRGTCEYGLPVDENIAEIAKRFYSALPSEYPFDKSLFYNECLIPNATSNSDVLKVSPRKSKEEYERDILGLKLNRYGGLVTFKNQFEEYDKLMFEYLMFYGEEISAEQKERIIRIIKNTLPAGYMKRSITYSKYFLETQSGKEFLRKNEGLVLSEMLAQVLECNSSVFGVKFSKIEEEIFRKLSIQDGETPMRRNEYIRAIAEHRNEYSTEIALLIAKIRKKFEMVHKEGGSCFADILSWAKEPTLDEYFFENFNADKIESDLPDEHGLTGFDYADITLGFLIETSSDDRVDACEYFDREEVQQAYVSKEKDIYNSRAVRKMAQTVIDEFSETGRYIPNSRREEIILKFVRRVSRLPDFNIFKEQEISDFIQLARIRDVDFIKRVETAVRDGINENPAYNMTNEEAKLYVDAFVGTVKERPITEGFEEEFDKFLRALTIIRLNDSRGTFPKHISEYLIRQALNENSILHKNWAKYFGVFERAIENLSIIDAAKSYDDKSEFPIYKTRDLVSSSKNLGGRTAFYIGIQRKSMHSILDGELDAIKTMYHENTHFGQETRLKKLRLKSFNEYMMLKESILIKHHAEYYEQNYFLTYIEIEARQVAAQKTIQFIDAVITGIIPQKIAVGLDENLANNMRAKFEAMKKRLMQDVEDAEKQYEDGYVKKYFGIYGQERKTINEFFSYYMGNSIASFIPHFPALQYEYNEDGSKKNISEQLDFVDMHRYELDLPAMGEIITRLSEEEFRYDIDVFNRIDSFMQVASSKKETEFINKIAAGIIPLAVDSYLKKMKSCRKKDESSYYSSYLKIVNILSQVESEDGAQKFCGFTVENKNGVIPVDALKKAKALVEERFPEFDARRNGRGTDRFGYSGLQAVTMQVTPYGMQTVADYEKRINENENKKIKIQE